MYDESEPTTRPTGPRDETERVVTIQIMFTGSRTIRDHHKIREMITGAVYDILGLFKDHRRRRVGTTHRLIVAHGCAAGLDTIVERWAEEDKLHNDTPVLVREYPADWDRYGRSAGMRRNHQMILDSDACIAIWDGHSRGTKHAFYTARETGLKSMLIIPDREFIL